MKPIYPHFRDENRVFSKRELTEICACISKLQTENTELRKTKVGAFLLRRNFKEIERLKNLVMISRARSSAYFKFK